jgi:hypothetical protein
MYLLGYTNTWPLFGYLNILPPNIISKYQDDRDNEYGSIQYKRKHFTFGGVSFEEVG